MKILLGGSQTKSHSVLHSFCLLLKGKESFDILKNNHNLPNCRRKRRIVSSLSVPLAEKKVMRFIFKTSAESTTQSVQLKKWYQDRAEEEITVEVVGKVSAVAILRILIVIENVFIREALGFLHHVEKKYVKYDKCSAGVGIG